MTSPFECHHDPHVSSLVARNNSKKFQQHQEESRSIFLKTNKAKRLQVGDIVFKKLKPKVITKEVSFFYPRWSQESYQITKIHKEQFPYVYTLSNHPTERKFYAHELQKTYGTYSTENEQPKITITKILRQPITTLLRSGSEIPTGTALYFDISKDGIEKKNIPLHDLQFYKKTFGKKSLQLAPGLNHTSETLELTS